MEQYKLNNNWCLWYHSINDTQWTNSSYKNLLTITNIYELKTISDIIEQIHLQNGMFFLMKENIFPTWEDPDNREGCCISFKIPVSILKEQWTFIVERILTGDILIDRDTPDINQYINGVSISPKREFNIIKIWLRNYDKDYTNTLKEYEPHFLKEKSIVKKHELSN